MIKVTQIKINIHHSDKDLENKIAKKLGIKANDIKEYYIVKRSLDARDKEDIKYSYTIQVRVEKEIEDRIIGKAQKTHYTDIIKDNTVAYELPQNGNEKLINRPVIVGFGPGGMFAGLSLARAGLKPIILERGQKAEERKQTVERFWETSKLDIKSNVSFGEGGAGTFSDGKLNTLVKDVSGRNTEVLRSLVEFGADSEIMYVHNPHIGTDKLIEIVTNIRKEIIRLGGEVRFDTEVTDFIISGNRITGVELDHREVIDTDIVILAIGHSSRETFTKLHERNIYMEPKSFAVGLRIQHTQSMIDISQFGKEAEFLSPASYKLTETTAEGRGVYSFCMCPGGYVVDASSEDGMKCVNGMSYHDRGSVNANSALIVSVDPSDFGSDGPLAGLEFQRQLEAAAYAYGDGNIPVQLLGDYINKKDTTQYGDVEPMFKGATTFSRLDECLPSYIHSSLCEAMPSFEKRIKGFSRYDAILAGVESRTSSPIRIKRDEMFNANVQGIYPCGEGAGYAGGITSAAMDGLKVAERIIQRYERLE